MKATRNLKIWFVFIEGQEEGPYSLGDLKKDRRLTPYTLVRRVGSKKWLPLGKIRALKAVFEDEVRPPAQEEGKAPVWSPGGETALMNPSDPDGPITLVVFILLLLTVWMVYNILT